MLQVKPDTPHQRIGFVFGSRDEVERIERYHAEGPAPSDEDTPLFNMMSGLFRRGA